MAKNPTWIRSYLKLGKEAFDEYTLSVLRLIEKKYSEDYLVFLEELRKSFPKTTNIGKLAFDLTSKVKQSIKIIRDLRGWYGGRATKTEVQFLFSLLEEIEFGIKELAKQSGASQELRTVLENVYEQTNVSIEEIQKSHSKVRKAVAGVRASKRKKKESRKSSGIGRGILTGLMGTSAAGVTIGASRLPGKIYRGAKGAISSRRKSSLMDKLSTTAFPSDIREGETTAPVVAPTAANVDLTPSLYSFFNKQAFSAAWTREVLSSLRGLNADLGTKGTKGGLGAGLKGLLGGLALKDLVKPVLGAAAALGIVGVGVGGMRSFGKKQLGKETSQIGYEAQIDRLRAQQGAGPVARPTEFVQKRQGRVAFAKLLSGEKLSKEELSALWMQQKEYAGKALEKGKASVQKGVTSLTGIKFSGSPFKKAEIELSRTAERIVELREQNKVLAEALKEQLGVGKKSTPSSEDPYVKMDKTTREFMQKQMEAINRLDKSIDKLGQQRTRKEVLPIRKDDKYEEDTSRSWMNSNSM
jgi:hypothetical protein